MPSSPIIDSLDIASLRPRLAGGEIKPSEVVASVMRRIAEAGDDKVWIWRPPETDLAERAHDLESRSADRMPLYGIPFAIKDNIDVVDWPTTAGCPAYEYRAEQTAPAVQRLLDAGAILIGKTNLDQFATGLVGARSPYGTSRNPIDASYIPGGSSSGSAVAVSSGLVSFALGTDTAGSGRVPAAFNNIVGLKPTRGRLSTRGVVPACRTLDCVSVFALTTADVQTVYTVAERFDPDDPFARRAPVPDRLPIPDDLSVVRIGVPRAEDLEFFGNQEAEQLFAEAINRIESLGARTVEIDFTPFLECARLLYGGPWVAERYIVVEDLIETNPDALHPITREVIGGGATLSAADTFRACYRLAELKRQMSSLWQEVELLVTPTAGTIYTIAEVEADPITTNSNLGTYTNFMNLLDLCGLAIPAGFQSDGLPFGVTLVAPAFEEAGLFGIGAALHEAAGLSMGATGRALSESGKPAPTTRHSILLCVNGAHMSGLPLNHQLTDRGARLVRRCRTAPVYRLFALTGFDPPRPGLLRATEGHAIEVEVWEVPSAQFGSFVADIPAPLGIGKVILEDGSSTNGFLCEALAV